MFSNGEQEAVEWRRDRLLLSGKHSSFAKAFAVDRAMADTTTRQNGASLFREDASSFAKATVDKSKRVGGSPYMFLRNEPTVF